MDLSGFQGIYNNIRRYKANPDEIKISCFCSGRWRVPWPNPYSGKADEEDCDESSAAQRDSLRSDFTDRPLANKNKKMKALLLFLGLTVFFLAADPISARTQVKENQGKVPKKWQAAKDQNTGEPSDRAQPPTGNDDARQEPVTGDSSRPSAEDVATSNENVEEEPVQLPKTEESTEKSDEAYGVGSLCGYCGYCKVRSTVGYSVGRMSESKWRILPRDFFPGCQPEVECQSHATSGKTCSHWPPVKNDENRNFFKHEYSRAGFPISN